jgi:hypothetical protein
VLSVRRTDSCWNCVPDDLRGLLGQLNHACSPRGVLCLPRTLGAALLPRSPIRRFLTAGPPAVPEGPGGRCPHDRRP